MPRFRKASCFPAFVATVLLTGTLSARGADTLRVQGSVIATIPVRAAASEFKSETGVELKMLVGAGSSQAIAAVGAENVDVAVTSRALTAEDRATFPSRRFEELRIGSEVFALVVAEDVWLSGVHTLTREQMTGIFERKIRNWKQVGGDDREIKFYRPQSGYGAWEEFATWLYDEVRNAPLGDFEIVPTPEDARDSVEFNAGSMTVIAPRYANAKSSFALGIKKPDGRVVQPTEADVETGNYPIMRPVFLVAGNHPADAIKTLFDFFQSATGRASLQKSGLIPAPQKAP